MCGTICPQPADTADFTSLTNFKKSVMRVDITARLRVSLKHFVYLISSCVTV